MKITEIVYTLLGYLIISIIGCICIVPCIIIACLPERWRFDNRVYYWFVHIVYKGSLFATFLPITIRGREYFPTGPAIFVANHQSALDIPLLGSVVNSHPHVWLFLKRYAKVPIFGFITRRMNIVVDHTGLRKLVGSLEKAVTLIKGKNRHVILFPEGGRHTDGKIHNFFYGFAFLAKELGRPVVPIFMKNVNKAYPPGSFWLHQYPITIIIGKPFMYQQGESEEEFVQRVRAWFVEQAAE